MYNQNQYPYPMLFNPQMFYMYPPPFYFDHQTYSMYMQNFLDNQQEQMNNSNTRPIKLKDYGPGPVIVNIEKAAKQNNTFRTVLWTGENFQVTVMSIPVGEDIGLEVHETGDQFIRVEDGQGLVKMGKDKNNLDFQKRIYEDYAIMIPEGAWHNIINTGDEPLKLYIIYAPPEHPRDTVHQTKADAEADERYYN